MKDKFILKNIEEDNKYLYFYIYEKYKEKNIINYIKYIYIKNNTKKYVFEDITKNGNVVICKIEKQYLSEIIEYNNTMLLKVGLDLYNEIIDIDILYENFECWFWNEHNFYLVSNNEKIYLCNTIDEIIRLKNKFEGSYEYIDENNGIISIIDSTINLETKKILVKRRFNYTIKYELSFRSRKDRIDICDVKSYNHNGDKLKFKITPNELNMLGNYSNIYDIFIILSIENYRSEIRIKSKNVNISPNISYGINKFYELRAYTTQDGFFSFIIKNFQPKIEIKTLKIDDENIRISGNILELMNYELNVNKAYINDNKNIKHYINILYNEVSNDIVDFNINISVNNLIKEYIEYENILNIVLDLKLFGKECSYILKYNSDVIKKEDCIIYPSVKKYHNNEEVLITPKYYKQDLVIKMERNFDTKIELKKIDLKYKDIRFVCEHNLKLNQANLSLNVDFIDNNNQEKRIFIDSNFKIDDKKIIFHIPLNKIRKLNFDEDYRIRINLYNNNINFYKDISTKFISKSKRYNANLFSVFSQKKFFVIIEDNSKVIIRVKDIMNLYKVSKTKYLIAKKAAMFFKNFFRNKIWLIGENLGDIAQDNGFAFFEYCINNRKNKNVFYISKKNNKDKEKLQPYKNKILIYNSFKHFFYYELAQYLIVSHGIRDVMPSLFHDEIYKNKKDIIYLQHGIIAMKKVYFNKKSYNNKIFKFVVTSDREKEILVNKMNFNEEQVIVTGLARFDKLLNKDSDKKRILIMPTWRDWEINNRETFISSKFYRSYCGLLKNNELNEILKKNNIELKFYPHIEIQKKYMDLFENINDNINIVKLGEETVQDLIKECSLMITDYSSVALDFNYLKKPVIFYQFDLDDYTHYRGSFIDLKTQLPGDICENSDEVVQSIKKYINDDFKYNEQYFENSMKFYKYRDKNNCKRIYKAITM